MPQVSNFTTITDAAFVLRQGATSARDILFALPDDAEVLEGVLVFMVDSVDPPNFRGFRVLINGIEQLSAQYNGDLYNTIHEIVENLRIGRNTVRFELQSGAVQISDVILWYRRNI